MHIGILMVGFLMAKKLALSSLLSLTSLMPSVNNTSMAAAKEEDFAIICMWNHSQNLLKDSCLLECILNTLNIEKRKDQIARIQSKGEGKRRDRKEMEKEIKQIEMIKTGKNTRTGQDLARETERRKDKELHLKREKHLKKGEMLSISGIKTHINDCSKQLSSFLI